MHNKSMKRFITTTTAAEIVGTSQFTILQEIKEGRLPALLINRNWRIAVADLERWVQARYKGHHVTIDRTTGELELHSELEAVTAS